MMNLDEFEKTIKDAKNVQDVTKALKDAGIDVTDEELQKIAGGAMGDAAGTKELSIDDLNEITGGVRGVSTSTVSINRSFLQLAVKAITGLYKGDVKTV
ncbi:MAG: bacteriocin [Lachnospiraceae bacterium]|nr:bacteriocin [Lachnospiraceae bacterium]